MSIVPPEYRKKLTTAFVVILSFTTTCLSASDSLRYINLKESLSDSSGCRDYIEASQELFEEGLYTDAYRLLKDLCTELEQSHRRNTEPVYEWSFISSLSYTKLESILSDTAVMMEEEKDSIKRMLDSPAYFTHRIEYQLKEIHRLLNSISLSLDVSGSGEHTHEEMEITALRLRPGFEIDIAPENSIMSMNIRAETEKRVLNETFKSPYYDPGDNRDLFSSEISLNLRKRLPWISFSVPLSYETDLYRRNTPGYISEFSYFTSPSIQLPFLPSGLNVYSSYTLRYNDFFNRRDSGIKGDSADNLIHGPDIYVDLKGDRIMSEAEFSIRRYSFPKQDDIDNREYLYTRISMRQVFSELLPGKIYAGPDRQIEVHPDYTLRLWRFSYSLEYSVDLLEGMIEINPSAGYTDTRSPVDTVNTVPEFLTEEQHSFHSGLEIQFSRNSLRMSAGYNFSYDNIDEKECYTKENTQNHGIRGSISWNITKDIFLDAELYRGYIEEDVNHPHRSRDLSFDTSLSFFF
ncbi:MAG: hypothetical protein ACOCSE_00225 [Chitinivibrionales bacterium]